MVPILLLTRAEIVQLRETRIEWPALGRFQEVLRTFLHKQKNFMDFTGRPSFPARVWILDTSARKELIELLLEIPGAMPRRNGLLRDTPQQFFAVLDQNSVQPTPAINPHLTSDNEPVPYPSFPFP